MDSALSIRDDSCDATVVVEANGRSFTILLCEDPRADCEDPRAAHERLGAQIFGLLDNYCGWISRQGKVAPVATDLGGKRVACGIQDRNGTDLADDAFGSAILSSLTSNDVVAGPGLPVSCHVPDGDSPGLCLEPATTT
jgi:hypothetical protein